MRMPTYRATDTEFTVISPSFVEREPRLWDAINEWCRFHGIDPRDVPLVGPLVRNVDACRVEYYRIQRDNQGHPVVGPGEVLVTRWTHAQGETPPLPFPTPDHDHDHDHDCSEHFCWRPSCCNPRRPDCTPETT